MWPWEHAIVGYLAYSVFCHLYYRDSPGALEALAVVFASVLPDLVDKPLAWQFGVFDSGYALGHSIFFAVPFAILVGVATRVANRRRAGVAFGIGYLLHLPSDVLYHYTVGDAFQPELMFWPVYVGAPSNQDLVANVSLYFARYQEQVFTSDPTTYVWIQLGAAGAAFLLWLYDGAPVLRELVVGAHRFLLGVIDGPRRRERERRNPDR